jgi:glucose/galactose transporter
MQTNVALTPNAIPGRRRETIISMVIIGLVFFIIGMMSWVNSILIPYFKIACELTHFQSYLVAFAFYISYFVMSVPSAIFLKRVGFKTGMMVAFFVMGIGAFLFIPAALTRTFEVFLLGLFSLGIGLSVLQTTGNTYATIVGPKEKALQRFALLGIANKAAGILAPLLFAAAVLKASDSELIKSLPSLTAMQREIELDLFIRRIIVPYSIVGCILVAVGAMVRYSPLPDINTENESSEIAAANAGKTTILQFPHLILGAIAIFLHVGTQVIAIDTVIAYAGSMHIPLFEAKTLPSYTLTCNIISYFIGIVAIPKFFSQVQAFRFCAVLGAVFTMLIIFGKGQVTVFGHVADISLWFVVLLGLANGLIWAGIWPLALDGLGRFTKTGAAVLIMGLCGNAILPLIYGYFADLFDLRSAYWVLLPCYAYLAFYAFYGHSIRRWRKNAVLT